VERLLASFFISCSGSKSLLLFDPKELEEIILGEGGGAGTEVTGGIGEEEEEDFNIFWLNSSLMDSREREGKLSESPPCDFDRLILCGGCGVGLGSDLETLYTLELEKPLGFEGDVPGCTKEELYEDEDNAVCRLQSRSSSSRAAGCWTRSRSSSSVLELDAKEFGRLNNPNTPPLLDFGTDGGPGMYSAPVPSFSSESLLSGQSGEVDRESFEPFFFFPLQPILFSIDLNSPSHAFFEETRWCCPGDFKSSLLSESWFSVLL
jgi:hypothetical protein